MKAADWQDAENYRNKIVAELMEYCVEHGLSSVAEDTKMTIELPTVAEINVWPEHEKQKRFNHKAWGNIDIFGNPLPDGLQPPSTTLEEGEAPDETQQ